MDARPRRLHPPRLPKYVFKIRDLYYFRYLCPKDIALRLNKKELSLALMTRYMSEAEQRAVKLFQAIYTYMEETRSMNLTDQQAEASKKLQVNLELE